MAWSDLRGQTLNSLSDLLNMKNQRRAQLSDQIVNVGRQLGQQKFQASESAAQREFLGGESAAQREFEAGQAEEERGFLTGEREAGQEFTSGQAAEQRDWEAEQARLDRLHELARDAENNNAAYSRLEAQINAEKDAMQRAWEDPARRYGQTQSFYSPRTEKTYRWNTEQEHQMAMAELEGDLLANRLELQASLGDGDSADDWVELYTGLRNDVMSDYGTIWNGEMWLGVPDEQVRQRIIDEFNSSVDGLVMAGQRSPQWAEWAKDRFARYVDNAAAEEQPADAPTGGGYPRNETLTTPQYRPGVGQLGAFNESTPEQRDTTWNIEAQIGLPVGTITGAGQETVTTNEKELFDRLISMYEKTYGPDFDPRVQEYLDELNQPGTATNLATIESFLRRAGY